MTQPTLDDPEYRRRVVRACLWVSPLGFLIAWAMGLFLGADDLTALAMGAVMLVGCLCAAGLIHLRGTAAARDVFWVMLLLRLFGIR